MQLVRSDFSIVDDSCFLPLDVEILAYHDSAGEVACVDSAIGSLVSALLAMPFSILPASCVLTTTIVQDCSMSHCTLYKFTMENCSEVFVATIAEPCELTGLVISLLTLDLSEIDGTVTVFDGFTSILLIFFLSLSFLAVPPPFVQGHIVAVGFLWEHMFVVRYQL